jgi:hypothetical protein
LRNARRAFQIEAAQTPSFSQKLGVSIDGAWRLPYTGLHCICSGDAVVWREPIKQNLLQRGVAGDGAHILMPKE